jgi:hypothetical protein
MTDCTVLEVNSSPSLGEFCTGKDQAFNYNIVIAITDTRYSLETNIPRCSVIISKRVKQRFAPSLTPLSKEIRCNCEKIGVTRDVGHKNVSRSLHIHTASSIKKLDFIPPAAYILV